MSLRCLHSPMDNLFVKRHACLARPQTGVLPRDDAIDERGLRVPHTSDAVARQTPWRLPAAFMFRSRAQLVVVVRIMICVAMSSQCHTHIFIYHVTPRDITIS